MLSKEGREKYLYWQKDESWFAVKRDEDKETVILTENAPEEAKDSYKNYLILIELEKRKNFFLI